MSSLHRTPHLQSISPTWSGFLRSQRREIPSTSCIRCQGLFGVDDEARQSFQLDRLSVACTCSPDLEPLQDRVNGIHLPP
jgi:hypothetical protein